MVLGRSDGGAGVDDVHGTSWPPTMQLDAGAALKRLVILFPGAGVGALVALHTKLQSLDLPTTAGTASISEVLARVSHGDLGLAREILARLRCGIDLHDGGRLTNASDQAVERGAWRTAQLLSRSEQGFRLLQSLQPVDCALGRAGRIILQVADHCLPLSDNDPLPQAFDALIETDPLQRHGLPAAVRRAAFRMLEPGAILSAKERGLIFAWEQGFRADGPGTPLHAVKHRLAKFTHKSIPRVEASRWRSLAQRLCGRKKSPLSAMRMGMQGAHLGTLAAQQAQVRQARPDAARARGKRTNDLRLSRPDRWEAAHLLERLISNMQSSASARFSDGSRRGLSLHGLTIGMSNFLHTAGIPFGLRLNVSRQRGKRSELAIACSTAGGEISFGTETRRQNTLGAGAIAGYDVDVGAARLRCGFGVEVARTRQARRSSGVVVRVARRRLADGKGHDDARMKSGMRGIVRFLFDESVCKKDVGPDAVFDRFASRFFDDPDISIGAAENRHAIHEYSAAASVSATAKVAATGLRIGPSAALVASRTAVRQHCVADGAGRQRATSYRNGVLADIAFTAGLSGKVGSNASDVGILNTSIAQLRLPLFRHGRSLQAKLMRERGCLQPEACTLDLEFTSVDDYAKAIADEIATADAAFTDRKNCETPETGTVPMIPQADAIAAHVADARKFARNNQTFVIRKRLRPAVAQAIDRNADAAETIQGCDHLPAAQRLRLCRQLDAQSVALLARDDAWCAPELKVMERSGRLRRLGLLCAVQLASESQAGGERCLATLRMDPTA